jgi:hypothetical protein
MKSNDINLAIWGSALRAVVAVLERAKKYGVEPTKGTQLAFDLGFLARVYNTGVTRGNVQGVNPTFTNPDAVMTVAIRAAREVQDIYDARIAQEKMEEEARLANVHIEDLVTPEKGESKKTLLVQAKKDKATRVTTAYVEGRTVGKVEVFDKGMKTGKPNEQGVNTIQHRGVAVANAGKTSAQKAAKK